MRRTKPPRIEDGPFFHFSERMQTLCADIALKCEAFRHLDVSQILFGVAKSRSGRGHGLLARVTPLRFAEGRLDRFHHGAPYRVQRFRYNDCEILYLVAFCLPRFLNRTFEDKMITVFHELYHISPAFDGDLRRHPGRYSVHTSSQKEYDRLMAEMAKDYLTKGGADPQLYSFLKWDFAQLRARCGRLIGHQLPRPKLVRMSN